MSSFSVLFCFWIVRRIRAHRVLSSRLRDLDEVSPVCHVCPGPAIIIAKQIELDPSQQVSFPVTMIRTSRFLLKRAGASAPPPVDEASPQQQHLPFPDDGLCLVCMANPPDAVLLECGHAGVCAACAARLWDRPAAARRCPLCRTPISAVVRILSEDADGTVPLPPGGAFLLPTHALANNFATRATRARAGARARRSRRAVIARPPPAGRRRPAPVPRRRARAAPRRPAGPGRRRPAPPSARAGSAGRLCMTGRLRSRSRGPRRRRQRATRARAAHARRA